MAKNKRMFKLAATLVSASLLFACNNETTEEQNSETAASDPAVAEQMTALVNEAVVYAEDDDYTDWHDEDPVKVELTGTDADFASSAALIFEDNVLTIKAGGTYVVTGNLAEGQIVVDSEDKKTVRLVLNGVEIHSADSSAIYIKDAEKAVISLEENTENIISDGSQYVFEDSSEDEPDAAIFSTSDLTVNGSGKLAVTGNYNDGIASKDELKVTGGTIQVTAEDDGLKGRDLVAVKAGTFTIEAGGDGIKSTNDEDADKGTIVLEGGEYAITSGNDGIQAETSLLITDGSYRITAGGGSPETIETAGDTMPGTAQEAPVETTDEESVSTKGIKAGSSIEASGGAFVIDSLDDSLHSNGDLTVSGGEWEIATGDDGVHADALLSINDGMLTVAKSYEGIEGNQITIEGGTIQLTAVDDGINVSGGNAVAPGEVQPTEEAAETATETEQVLETLLTINGGVISVDAAGDGIDSNGSIEMNGGTMIVNGPTENMNGSLDYDVDFNVTGGLVIAAGSSGMSQAASAESAQASVVMTYPETQAAGTIVHLQDSVGNTLATFAPAKDYQAIFISSPDLVLDSVYTLSSGGTSAEEQTNGLYADGGYEGGTKVIDFTVTEQVTWVDENGIAEAGSSGAAGGLGGTPPEAGSTPPEGAEGSAGMTDMDDETREKMRGIMEQQMNGAITEEEAQEQMAELGIEMPERQE